MDPLSLLLSTVQAFSGAQQPAYYQPAPSAYQQPYTVRKFNLYYMEAYPVKPTNDDYLKAPQLKAFCSYRTNNQFVFCGGSQLLAPNDSFQTKLVRVENNVYTLNYAENAVLQARNPTQQANELQTNQQFNEVTNALEK